MSKHEKHEKHEKIAKKEVKQREKMTPKALKGTVGGARASQG